MSIARSSYLKNTSGGSFVDQRQGGTVLGQDLSLKDSAVSQDTNLKQNSTTTKIVSGGEFGRMRRGKYVIKGATTEIAALESFILSFLGTFASIFKNLYSRDTVSVIVVPVVPDAPPPVCRFTLRVEDVANLDFLYLWFPQNADTVNISVPAEYEATDDDYDFVIDWGDGSEPRTVQSLADFDVGELGESCLKAPYTQIGDYNATITGKFDKGNLTCFRPWQRYMNVLSIEEWGGLKVDNYHDSWIVQDFFSLPVNHLVKEVYASYNYVFTSFPDAAITVETPYLDHMFFKLYNFNAPMNDWDISVVTSMRGMFRDAQAFNQPLDKWNTSNVTNMNTVFFSDAGEVNAFDQDISNWDFSSVTDMYQFGRALTLSPSNYDPLLIKWESQASSMPAMTQMHMGGSRYTAAAASARSALVNTYGWTITDGGQI